MYFNVSTTYFKQLLCNLNHNSVKQLNYEQLRKGKIKDEVIR